LKDIIVLGGPNGAGKTTAAKLLRPEKLGIVEFVNADEIARGLSPFDPDGAAVAAGRVMLQRMKELRQRGQSFAFETTCAGRTHIRFLKDCKTDGWRINLLFLWLPSPEAAIARVNRRIREGGHAIPPDVIVRRYFAGIANMRRSYLPLADVAAIYDNSDEGRVLIAERSAGKTLVIGDSGRWAKIGSASS
jgi:predicted ABC-type ATPase